MENQKLLDFDDDLPEQQPKTVSSVMDEGILTEDLKNNYENDINDLILKPEKPKTEKQPSIDNTFEVIDQESKIFHGVEDDTDVSSISKNEENEYLFESDPVVHTKVEDIPTLPKTESLIEAEAVVPEILEPKIIESVKTVQNLDDEPVNVVQPQVQPNIKIADNPEVIPLVPTKKDSDEGYVCDIKIGPEELFCRIGLGKLNYKVYIRI